jgi:hypothetical protein
MNAQAQALLIKEFNKTAEAMVDVEHIASMIRNGMDTDIKEGDMVIGTEIYEGGLFKVAELKKATARRDERNETIYKKLPNPYQEYVRQNDKTSRSANLTVKTAKHDNDGHMEWRIKMSRLALFRWDEETNSYPIIGEPIIFREKRISFAEKHHWMKKYYEDLLTRNDRIDFFATAERKATATKYLELINRLAKIPPFTCYWNDKYGFLVKRRVVMNQVVYPISSTSDSKEFVELPTFGIAPELMIASEAKKATEDFKAHIAKREEAGVFKEEIVKEALNPSRVETVMDKHGMEGVDATFDPSVEGVGRRW